MIPQNVRTRLLFPLFGLALAGGALAGGTGENILIIVDPGNAESMYVANYYKSKRGVPDANFIYMEPGASDYQQFVDVNLEGFFGSLKNKVIEDHVDYVLIPPGGSFYVSAPGLVSDGCASVNRFSIAAGYTLAFRAETILGGVQSGVVNQYSRMTWAPRAFDSSTAWLNGLPSTAPNARRYYIGAMLGYTGERGNTLTEILDLVDRSAAVDGTHPAGTFYYMETTDIARSGPRHDFYPTAVEKITEVGGSGQHLLANLPLGNHDCLGIMTGLATPDIDGADLTLLPGSFADHLTSFAGRFDTASQTKMSRWIAKGASGTAGTVEEPCNYPGKFPHARFHVVYLKGLSLGEAWFRSVGSEPFQNLLYGDPLTRPFAFFPSVDVPDAPVGTASGTVTLTPTVSATAPGAQIALVQLLVDGGLAAEAGAGEAFQLDTTELADGWHELRVLARDDKLNENMGRWIGALTVDNTGHAVSLGAAPLTGDLSQRFDWTYAASGGTVSEVRLLSNGRVVAASTNAADTLGVHGQNLGAGPVNVQAEALFQSGAIARSAPVTLDVAYTSGALAGIAPVAYGHQKTVSADCSFVLELPASFDDDAASAVFTVVQAPAQATIVSSTDGAYRVLTPLAGASGLDTLTFRVDTASGTSTTETIAIEYTPTCVVPAPFCATAPNSVGPGALMGFTGSTSISAGDFSLTSQGLPAGQFGIFYYGPDQQQAPFGDGNRCVGGQTFRLPVLVIDGGGAAEFAIDYASPPEPAGEITAGSTWNFQFWYRDPAAGASGFNLSDGLEASFCP